MSDNWGADQIPLPRGVRPSGKEIIEALSTAHDLPYEALDAALAFPASIADAVLAVLQQASRGEPLGDRERNLFFWGLHVLAAACDTRVAKPLLTLLLRDDEDSLVLSSELATGVLSKLVASTFDGDVDALEAAIFDPMADDLIQWGIFSAYSFLVFEERIPRERAHALLIRFDEEQPSYAGSFCWAGWDDAIALLGFDDLVGRRNAAVTEARVLSTPEEDAEFAANLETARNHPGDPARFGAQGIGYLDDPIGELEEILKMEEEFDEENAAEPDAPVVNPLRHVGRNDPCPCGSGRKYKKCCLDADAA